MSLLRAVIQEIHRTGEGSITTLAPLFPGKTRAQVAAAINNAARRKEIFCLKRGAYLGRPLGRAPGTYGPEKPEIVEMPKPKPKKPRHVLETCWLRSEP